MTTNEFTMENINHLAIRNVVELCQQFEDRIATLEAATPQTPATANGRERSEVPDNGFDLARYRGLLKFRIANLKQLAEETYGKITYERYLIQIEAYTHALKLLDT